MLEIVDLTRRYGARAAVDGVTLSVPDGQMVGVIGRSGAGKSTLLRMINRLTEPTSGRILHDGTDVTALRGRALRNWTGKLVTRSNCFWESMIAFSKSERKTSRRTRCWRASTPTTCPACRRPSRR